MTEKLIGQGIKPACVYNLTSNKLEQARCLPSYPQMQAVLYLACISKAMLSNKSCSIYAIA